MSKSKKKEIIPGDIYHPGEYLKEELHARAMSQQGLADEMNVSKTEISLIIHGHRNISPKMAVTLEMTLGIDAEFWMNLQIKYDIEKIKKKMRRSIKISKIAAEKKKKLKQLIKVA